MKNLFKEISENLLKTIGLKMIIVGENSLNTCLSLLAYEPDIPRELLDEMKKN